jgi:hypothetical protein
MILALNSVALLPPSVSPPSSDNSDSQYGRKMLEKLSQSNIKVPVVVRSHYVAVDEYGRKITT